MNQQFHTFQHELYLAGIGGQPPAMPMTFEALEAQAREVLDDRAFGYVAGGAGGEHTMAANRAAFRRWRLVPRMLRDVAERDLSREVLGRELPAPLLLAPVGVQSVVHPEAELAVARASSSLGLPFVLSTVSSHTLEDVAEAAGDGPRWFQLYWPSDPALARSLVTRAAEAGYEAVVITLDTRLLAWRPRDLTTAFLPFLHGEGIANYVADPVFAASLDEGVEDRRQAEILRWTQVFADPSQTWDDLAELVADTQLPVLVKGVQHPDDARSAVAAGVDGVIVSNHGGRQVDGAIGALEAVPDVVDAVGGDVEVLFDSGIRTGSDVLIALGLGARAVLVGRPYVYGLAVGGEQGVRHVLRSLLADMDLALALTGLRTVDELTREVLSPA